MYQATCSGKTSWLLFMRHWTQCSVCFMPMHVHNKVLPHFIHALCLSGNRFFSFCWYETNQLVLSLDVGNRKHLNHSESFTLSPLSPTFCFILYLSSSFYHPFAFHAVSWGLLLSRSPEQHPCGQRDWLAITFWSPWFIVTAWVISYFDHPADLQSVCRRGTLCCRQPAEPANSSLRGLSAFWFSFCFLQRKPLLVSQRTKKQVVALRCTSKKSSLYFRCSL